MADNAFQKGELTEVIYPVGTSERGEVRYKKANFELLQWKPPGASLEELYIITTSPAEFDIGQLNLAGHQDFQNGSDFGFYTGNQVILEPHQADGSDSGWRGVHGFDFL